MMKKKTNLDGKERKIDRNNKKIKIKSESDKNKKILRKKSKRKKRE